MRSRASGGICGDSVAATSAETMSSLRRRAIWMQRARSIERSSTGGRARARTTAPESPGSTRSRSQASTSRISARWKNAAAPISRYGTARSSRATATAWPSRRTERTSTHTDSGAAPSANRASTSAATLWACARSLSQRQNATLASPSIGAVRSSSATGSTTARAAAMIGARQRRLRSRRTTRGGGRSASIAVTFVPAAARKRCTAWSGSAAATSVAPLPAKLRATVAGPRSSSSNSSTST